MHAKVDELYQVVSALKRHHNESAVVKYADQPVLTEDIQKVDELVRIVITSASGSEEQGQRRPLDLTTK